jgi:ankyrin repeat protein
VKKATGAFGARALAAALVLAVAGGLAVPPAQAQFSDGYKFLDAIKKRDGQKVTDALSEPGSAIVNTRDVTTGDTALHLVTERRDVTWMRFLLQKGANVNARNAKGVTPMQIASNLGFLEGIEVLVKYKADVDESNDAGETPLISAVHRKDLAMVRVLLKAGADPDRADNSGRSARDYAALGGRNNALVTAIETDAKSKEERAQGKAVYGPTF